MGVYQPVSINRKSHHILVHDNKKPLMNFKKKVIESDQKVYRRSSQSIYRSKKNNVCESKRITHRKNIVNENKGNINEHNQLYEVHTTNNSNEKNITERKFDDDFFFNFQKTPNNIPRKYISTKQVKTHNKKIRTGNLGSIIYEELNEDNIVDLIPRIDDSKIFQKYNENSNIKCDTKCKRKKRRSIELPIEEDHLIFTKDKDKGKIEIQEHIEPLYIKIKDDIINNKRRIHLVNAIKSNIDCIERQRNKRERESLKQQLNDKNQKDDIKPLARNMTERRFDYKLFLPMESNEIYQTNTELTEDSKKSPYINKGISSAEGPKSQTIIDYKRLLISSSFQLQSKIKRKSNIKDILERNINSAKKFDVV